MKKLFCFVAVSLLSNINSGSAADWPSQPPNYSAPPPPYIEYKPAWSGFYIGGQGGYAFTLDRGSRQRGPFGGGTVGYNWQSGAVVFGPEIDAAYGAISETQNLGFATAKVSADIFGTARARLGFGNQNLLAYLTGGYAFARNTASATNGVTSISASAFHHGLTVGTGVEFAITRNISAKAEFLYVYLFSATYTILGTPVTSGDGNFAMVRGGINVAFR